MLDEFLLDKLAAQDDENEVMAALSLMPEDEPITPDCECNNGDHNILNYDCPLYQDIEIPDYIDECATHEMWVREAGR